MTKEKIGSSALKFSKMQKKFLIIGLASFLLMGCSEQVHETAELDVSESVVINSDGVSNPFQNEFYFKGGVVELHDEGAFTTQQIRTKRKDINYTVKRIPRAYYLKNKGLEGEELQLAIQETKGEQLFYIEFEQEQKLDLVKKYLAYNLDQNIAYLSFDIYKDFQLVTASGDTIAATYSLYERNFHVAPFERVMLSFNGVNEEEEFELLYNDRIFGNGALNFNFPSANYLENNYYAYKN
mgnify:CR=1 FL=1